MDDRVEVLCDIHHTPMEMVQYRWRVFPNDDNISTFMHCLGCARHYSPLQGYINITQQGMDTVSRRKNDCPNVQTEWHGSMAITGMKDGEFVWKCLHRECRGKK